MFVQKWEHVTRNFKKQDVRLTTYSTTMIGEEKLFQIQTYAADGHSSGAKQTIQFDRQRAIELMEILKREFSL